MDAENDRVKLQGGGERNSGQADDDNGRRRLFGGSNDTVLAFFGHVGLKSMDLFSQTHLVPC